MILSIDTIDNVNILLKLEDGGKILESKISAERTQGEKLLPAINNLLKSAKKSLKDLKEIKVADTGGSFTSLRIGVATANALAFALNIPVIGFSGHKIEKDGLIIVEPEYDREPDIGKPRNSVKTVD